MPGFLIFRPQRHSGVWSIGIVIRLTAFLSFSFHQLKGIHWCVYLRILDSRARVLVTLAGQPLQLFTADFHALRLSLFATEARVAAEPKESRHVMVVVASSYCPGRYTHVILVVVVWPHCFFFLLALSTQSSHVLSIIKYSNHNPF